MKRKDISLVFSHYLVLACWRKMQKRVGHWAIVCIISQLALIPHGALSRLNVEPSTQTDGRLASLLLCINIDKHLAQTLSHYRPTYVDGDDIPLLLSACKERGPLYTKATAIEFHRLLVGALIAFAAHLARKRVDQEDGLIVANGVLLHTIVYSNAFKAHMKSLSATYPPVLSLPTSSRIQDYQKFAVDNKIQCQVPRGNRKLSEEEMLSSGGGLGLATEGESKETPSATGGENKDAENEIVDATTESEIFVSPTDPVDLNLAIQSWLKLLVRYHTTQRTLENYCENLGTGEDSQIDITHLSVKPKRGLVPQWSDIAAVLTSVLTSGFISEPKETIEYLKSYVLGVVNAGKSTDNIILGHKQAIKYTVHCEAALVAFASTKNHKFQDDRLAPLHQVRIL